MELWEKMIDSVSHCVPVKSDSLWQKEKEGLE